MGSAFAYNVICKLNDIVLFILEFLKSAQIIEGIYEIFILHLIHQEKLVIPQYFIKE